MSQQMHDPDGRLDPAIGSFLTSTLALSVRTPLHSLLGFLELLAMSGVDSDQRRLVDQLVASSEELLSANDRLVWLLRLLTGTYTSGPAPVQLADVFTEVTGLLDQPVSVHVVAGTPLRVSTDAPALLQLLTELLMNATTHGRPAANGTVGKTPVSVVLGPARDDSHVRITISDGGPGLSRAAHQQLIGPLSCPSAGDTIGLQLTRQLADLLGVSLTISPDHPGTSIILELPTGRAARPLAAVGHSSSTDDPPTAPLRVLLVEDNATNRLLAQRQLDRLGHDLTAVSTGQAGVDAVLAGGHDVILMDLHLPDLDGCEATRLIRAAEAQGATPGESRARLPIIAITADATAQAREACLVAGVDEVLTKPVDLGDLAGALARASTSTTTTAGSHGAPKTAAVPVVLRRIAERVEADPAATALFISTYLSELPGRRLRIQASLRRAEPRTVLAAAESLRTASETMGATALAGACAALSAAARTQSLETARVFLPALLLLCQQLQEELAPYTDSTAVAAALHGL